MFNGCSALTSLDLSSFDTSKVTSMYSMFNGCSALTSLDLSSFDTSKVVSMANMIRSCSALTNLDVSNFDTSNVVKMFCMFMEAGVETLDVSSFNTSKVYDVSYMFEGCKNLSRIYASDAFTTSQATNVRWMFLYSTKLPNYNKSEDASMAKYDTDGGYFTFKAWFSLGGEKHYFASRPMVYDGDLTFGDDIKYQSANDFTLGADHTATYAKQAVAGDPVSTILPFAIHTDDYADVTFYDMDGNVLSGATIDGGTEFGMQVSASATITFVSDKGAKIIKSSVVYPVVVSTADMTEEDYMMTEDSEPDVLSE